jgi:hypothetical protein
LLLDRAELEIQAVQQQFLKAAILIFQSHPLLTQMEAILLETVVLIQVMVAALEVAALLQPQLSEVAVVEQVVIPVMVVMQVIAQIKHQA